MRLSLILLGCSLLIGGCSAAKKYEKFRARCAAKGVAKDCYRKGVYAQRLKLDANAREGFSEACEKGYKPACRKLKGMSSKGSLVANSASSMRPKIAWELRSKPNTAQVSWRLESTSPEVESVPDTPLSQTPFVDTRQLEIEGLTQENAKSVKLILTAKTPGMQADEEVFVLAELLKQRRVRVTFDLK